MGSWHFRLGLQSKSPAEELRLGKLLPQLAQENGNAGVAAAAAAVFESRWAEKRFLVHVQVAVRIIELKQGERSRHSTTRKR